MTTPAEISEWFDRGVRQGASHMLVMVDTFDYEDYPVYVTDVGEARQRYSSPGEMQRCMEVYNLKLDKQAQLDQARVFNF